MAEAVEEVVPGSVRMKFMCALGRWVRSFRRSKPRGMVGVRVGACGWGNSVCVYESVRNDVEV